MIKPNTLAKSYDWHSFFFTLDHVSCNSEIPVHCHLLDFVSCLFSNDIIYTHSFHLMIKYVHTWLKTFNVWQKNILCIFVSPSWQTLHMSILCLYFSNKIYFCNTHSDWLQLLLHASSWNHYRVTTEIWLILGWRGEVGRNLRLVKIWKHYHQKYQITKRYDGQLL